MILQLTLPGMDLEAKPPVRYFSTEMVRCECGDTLLFSEGLYLLGDFYCCEECAEYSELHKCPDCNDWSHEDDMHEYDNTWYCRDCFYDSYYHCEGCGDAESLDYSCYVDGVGCFCESCFNNDYFYCQGCEEARGRDIQSPNSDYCCDCRPESESGMDWDVRNETYNKVGNRRFGVELEYRNGDYETECDYMESDSEHCGMEYRSGIMHGDGGHDEMVKFTRYARSNGWQPSSACGYHLHIDCSDLDADQLKRVAFAYIKTAKFWERCVQSSRNTAGWSKFNSSDGSNTTQLERLAPLSTVSAFRSWATEKSRYYFINWAAYTKFGTVEIRGHEGTNDSKEVGTWIQAHTRFVDYVKDMPWSEIDKMFSGTPWNDYDIMTKIIGDDVCDFYAKKSEGHGKPITLVRNRFAAMSA